MPRINRREFIVSTSAVAVGAAAPGLAQTVRRAPGVEPRGFTSPSGARIPYAEDDLFSQGAQRTFTGDALEQVAFPLGGIGTGTVSLGGRGQLRDWEIFNRPGKGRVLPFTFTAVWVKPEGGAALLKAVEAPLRPPFTGSFGLARASAQGLPRLGGARFTGAYPFARVDFEDDELPLRISLEAFNPFIPLNVDDSSLPVAILHYRLASTARQPLEVALAFSLLNAVGYDGTAQLSDSQWDGFGQNRTTLRREEVAPGRTLTGLDMTSSKHAPGTTRHGSMAILTTHDDVTARRAWEGTAWFDAFQNWINEFGATGRFDDRGELTPSPDGRSMYGSLAPRLRLAPGETASVPFLLAWHFPVRENYWNREPEVKGQLLRNDYGTKFGSAWDVARYAAANLDRLEGDSRSFHDTFFTSSLPAHVLDAVSSQASIIRTNTALLLEGQRFFAFEGTGDETGCCPMNCTHVWNYEQALAFLFPSLERSMRRTDFTDNMKPDGSMAFRTLVPTGRAQWRFKPAADGQMGCVIKLYREWQMSGDDQFLRTLWPEVKRAVAFAWQYWDADKDGIMEGEQHNTYDIEFYGPNPMMTVIYLGALEAAARMADAVGDGEAEAVYRQLVESGRQKMESLWNGEYYVQRIPPPDQVQVQPLDANESWHAPSVVGGEPRYQFGDGCLSDQLLGQWLAKVAGLGDLLPPDRVRATLQSIYRHNFKHDFFHHPNAQRIYALNDEQGLVLCSWPGGNRPALPFVYADEVWTGIEYQVAAHLIFEGQVAEGLAIVKGIRDRYDGRRRNPWNEVECGSHYARALASWSVLVAATGFWYSAPEQRLTFVPRVNADDFKGFFVAGTGWGRFVQRQGARSLAARLEPQWGEIRVRRLELASRSPWPSATLTSAAGPDGALEGGLTVVQDRIAVDLEQEVVVRAGESLAVSISAG